MTKLELPLHIAALLLGLVGFLAYMALNKSAPVAKPEKRFPYIVALATANPAYRVSQKQALAVASNVPGLDETRPVLERIYTNSKIQYRYFSVPDFCPEEANGAEFFYPPDGSFNVPIETRLEKYREVGLPLLVRVCNQAIRDSTIPNPLALIHKLILVSSTGFLGPGLDVDLMNALGLSPNVERCVVGYMGCGAGMNGIRVGCDFVSSHPESLALVICIELSSLHTTFEDSVNDAILHAIFADGACAVLLGSDFMRKDNHSLFILDGYSQLISNSLDGITLSIATNGISCTLSKHLPAYIAKSISSYVDGALMHFNSNLNMNLTQSSIDFWAVHPGGRRILEEACNGLNLTPAQVKWSYQVLNDYGNMLSPSIVFVIEKMMQDGWESGKNGFAFSFSPGVGVEGVLLLRN